MINRPALLFILCALALPPLSSAQQNKLLVSPVVPVTVKRGGTVTDQVKVAVLSGFHVNSDHPTDEFLIPLKLTWTTGPLTVKSVTYPKAEDIKVGSEVLPVFTGNFAIQTVFEVPRNAPSGTAEMVGKIRYQACNNQMCFRPSSADVRLPVIIE
jgi:hypothetical protein